MAKQSYTKEQWAILNANTKLAARLGFDVSNTAFWISKKDRNTGATKYSKCNFSNVCVWDENLQNIRKTPLKTFLSSHFGRLPIFDQPRIPKKPELTKWKNVIAPIVHPNLYAYDFDNHNRDASLSDKIQEIYTRLHQNKGLLIGYKTGFDGLHVFCLSSHKAIVEKECEEFIEAGGNVDIFNSDKGNGIGIPGFDHYLYKKEEVDHFINLIDVQIKGRVSIYKSKSEQSIVYPKPLEISPDVLKTIQLYKDAKANIELHKNGIKNCVRWKHKKGIEQGVEYIETLMGAEGYRTEILLSSNGHSYIIRALANLNIQDIDDFRRQFPDFEDNHYALIEERIEYIQRTNNKKVQSRTSSNTNYANKIKDLEISLKTLFEENNIKPKKNLLSVATYLTNCMDNNIRCPGYIHYIEFCKMNEREVISERSYYRMVTECQDNKLISVPNKQVWAVGKKCREIEKGKLLNKFDIDRKKQGVDRKKKANIKVFDYIKVNINYIRGIPFLPTILCTAKTEVITTTDLFCMKNCYSLRPQPPPKKHFLIYTKIINQRS